MSYYLIHEIGPTRTSMVTYLFPLGGVILGVAFLNEELTWQLLVGAALGAVAFLLAVRGRDQVAKAGTLIPEQTIETIEEDVEWARARATSARK